MPNPNKIARVDLNSVLFWTAQVIDRAYSGKPTLAGEGDRRYFVPMILMNTPLWS